MVVEEDESVQRRESISWLLGGSISQHDLLLPLAVKAFVGQKSHFFRIITHFLAFGPAP